MKWIKGMAALLASLLLLLMAAQALGPSKATSRETREAALTTRTEPPGEDLHKIPILPVLPETAEQPLTVVAPPLAETTETRPPEGPAESSGTSQGTGTPRFPDAEPWQLTLVNPWNELPEDYEMTLESLPGGHQVDQRAYDDLNAMLEACREAGLSPKICSSYRTQAKQTYLYNNKIARLRKAGYSKAAAEREAGRWVARPGTSEHQLGLALDIVSSSYQALTKKQEKTAEQKWLMEHCWEYGFILRYPNEKSEITGIGYEPWHYRYVGVDVALDIRDSGLCLEEHLLARAEVKGPVQAADSLRDGGDIWDEIV